MKKKILKIRISLIFRGKPKKASSENFLYDTLSEMISRLSGRLGYFKV